MLAQAAGYLFDVDGCLVISDLPGGEGGRLLPGAREVLERVRSTGKSLAIFTNASGRTPEEYAAILRDLGLTVSDREVITPPVVAAIYIRRVDPEGPVLAFGGSAVEEPLRRSGIATLSIEEAERARFVFVGADREFVFPKLDAACRAVWAGAELLVASGSRWFAGATGRSIGVSAAIAAGIAYVTGAEPKVIGKPSTFALEASAAALGADPTEMVVVGDDLEMELAMGHAGGAMTVLVLTGVTDAERLEQHADGFRPDLVLADVGRLLDYL